MIARIFCLSLLVSLASGAPQSPEECICPLQLEEGLRVELVAADPDVIDSIAMAFAETGNLFVVEGRGYLYPMDECVAGRERVGTLRFHPYHR